MSEIDPKTIPEVKDKTPPILGLLPKNAQAQVLAAIALVMVLVIVFSGRNAPKESTAKTASPGTAIMDPNQARIQEYRTRLEEQTRQLAAEEAQLAQTKDVLGVRGTTGSTGRLSGSVAPSPALCVSRGTGTELDRA